MKFSIRPAALLLFAVKSVARAGVISPAVFTNGTSFGKTSDGHTAHIYTLTNKHGMRVRFTDYGGRITDIDTPDRAGKFANVAIGFRDVGGYEASGGTRLPLWSVSMRPLGINHGAVLTLVSADGALRVRMRYTLMHDDEIRIDTRATAIRPTPFNPIVPAWFNLTGKDEDIAGHLIQIRANSVVETDANQQPIGQVVGVSGPLDLRTAHVMRDGLDAFRAVGQKGYDARFVLATAPRKNPVPAARVTEPASGRMMEVETTEPALQFITESPDGAPHDRPIPRAGFTLVAQPLGALRPGQTYRSSTIYRFVTPVDRLHN